MRFGHLRGLKIDLVLVSEEVGSYDDPLISSLRRLTEAQSYLTGVDQPGGVYLRSANKMSKEELIVHPGRRRGWSWSRARGTLRQQLRRDRAGRHETAATAARRQFHEEPSAPLPFMELKYFNDFGGFTADGKEYVIYLGPDRQTPLPWVNIMANPDFGTLISEAGSGFIWGGNSQDDRLTPWSNDPISDPPGTAIYIRDDEIGAVWSPDASADPREGCLPRATWTGLHRLRAQQPRHRAGTAQLRAGR